MPALLILKYYPATHRALIVMRSLPAVPSGSGRKLPGFEFLHFAIEFLVERVEARRLAVQG